MQYRIQNHPILPIPQPDPVDFFWQDRSLTAQRGETLAAALIANGIRIFGHHHKDGSPQGIYCANGQCSQCMVIANGLPVKSCMEIIKPGMRVNPVEGLPVLPVVSDPDRVFAIEEIEVSVLILGGGPAGMSAAIELGKINVPTILVDDRHRLGGKLVLQTHRFFGSSSAVYAGTRGIDIATRLEKDVNAHSSIKIWNNSTALAVFSDQKIGILKDNAQYILVKPQVLLVAMGAREKALVFHGNTLPGVYGAGAFQTLVNRDLVLPAQKLFIIGGGNVGLIAAYHAIQANIEVVGLAEVLPRCGGYKVHRDKLARVGVPIFNSHTVISANGHDHVESVTIAEVDRNFTPIPNTEKTFECDCLLVAVGLDPVNEFFQKAVEFGMPCYSAGDAEEIAEASAAIFSGKIRGFEIAKSLNAVKGEVPSAWYRTAEVLKSRPGAQYPETIPEVENGVFPVIHCTEEIPCDPCTTLCPNGLIEIDRNDIRSIPTFIGTESCCMNCRRCVAGCPGLAITLVDYRSNPEFPLVSIPFEFTTDIIREKDMVTALDTEGNLLGKLEVLGISGNKGSDRTWVVQLQAPKEYARRVAGIRIQEIESIHPIHQYMSSVDDDIIVCRCERVTAGEIRSLIRQGYKDINEIKTVTRAGMGACGSKTCSALIQRLFREEGIPLDEVTIQTRRPLFVEVPLGVFAGLKPTEDESHG